MQPTPVALPAPSLWQLTLPNGLRVWGEARSHCPTVVAHLVVGAGARDAPQGQNGLPHFVEHTLFSGSERWREGQLRTVIGKLGAHQGGYTGLDATGYWVQASAEHTARALEWLAQLVFHPTFPEHKVIKERQAIARECALRDPEFERVLRRLNIVDSLDDAIVHRLYGEDPERSLGTAAELARLTRATTCPPTRVWSSPGRPRRRRSLNSSNAASVPSPRVRCRPPQKQAIAPGRTSFRRAARWDRTR
jgi:predicted Zn-dependent peptidase